LEFNLRAFYASQLSHRENTGYPVQTLHNRSYNRDNSGIIFPRLESWNSATNTATLAVDVNKKRVLCRVELGTLENYFGVSEELPMHVVAQHRLDIQNAARRLIEHGAYEDDGSVMIRVGDIDAE
jgi:hypothetical protein